MCSSHLPNSLFQGLKELPELRDYEQVLLFRKKWDWRRHGTVLFHGTWGKKHFLGQKPPSPRLYSVDCSQVLWVPGHKQQIWSCFPLWRRMSGCSNSRQGSVSHSTLIWNLDIRAQTKWQYHFSGGVNLSLVSELFQCSTTVGGLMGSVMEYTGTMEGGGHVVTCESKKPTSKLGLNTWCWAECLWCSGSGSEMGPGVCMGFSNIQHYWLPLVCTCVFLCYVVFTKTGLPLTGLLKNSETCLCCATRCTNTHRELFSQEKTTSV